MKSSLIISLFINASDILLCFFFLIRVAFNNFFKIPVEIENIRLELAIAIHAGAPITVTNDTIEMLPVVADKTIY